MLTKEEFYQKFNISDDSIKNVKKHFIIKYSHNFIIFIGVVIAFILSYFYSLDLFGWIIVISMVLFIIFELFFTKSNKKITQNYNEKINSTMFDYIFKDYECNYNKLFPEELFRKVETFDDYKLYVSDLYLKSHFNDSKLRFGKVKIKDYAYADDTAGNWPFEGIVIVCETKYNITKPIILTQYFPKYEEIFYGIKSKRIGKDILPKRYLIRCDDIENDVLEIVNNMMQKMSLILKELKDKVDITIRDSGIYIAYNNKHILEPKKIDKIYNDYVKINKLLEILNIIDQYLESIKIVEKGLEIL